MPATPIAASVSEDALYRKVARRVIPVLFVCYIAAYLERVNVGFAKLQMQADVPQISDAVYGLGAATFCWKRLAHASGLRGSW
jgi:sugar phosphate permease